MTHANQLLDCSHVDMARRKGRPVCLDTTKSRLQRLHTALWVFRADRAQKLSGTALASGSPANIILTPTTGTASSSNSATASGSFQGLAITPSTGGAAGSGSAAGSLGAITLTPITGTATGSTAGGATASGAFAPISVSAATALAVGSAMTQGGFQSIGITAATGTASGTSASSATATGSFASITLTPATGTATSPGTMTLTQADIDAIVAAVLVALNATTIPVDVQKMNAAELIGSGTIGDDWRGLGVPPQ